jgi:tRNA-specific 2-thiouridylase
MARMYVDLGDIVGERSVVVAMSGGVDSSVAAMRLVEAGFKVIGLTMKNFCYRGPELPESSCCSVEAIEDARRVATRLGLVHRVIGVEEEFQREVIEDFISEYQRARTPNPCIRCNSRIRFNELIRYAGRLGIHFVATGHYARIRRLESDRLRLARAQDRSKDQSYFLSPLSNPEMLGRVLFPLGGLSKDEVRRQAGRGGLPVADKDDSQEVCFVPGGSLKTFLAGRINDMPGPIETVDGRVVGEHDGLSQYTIGQRRKLGIATGEPRYVVELDRERNVLVVGGGEDLLKRGLYCTLQWFDELAAGKDDDGRDEGMSQAGEEGGLTAQIRSRHMAAAVESIVLEEGTARVVFAQPQRAVCPGQTVAFYQDEMVIGAGTIDRVFDPE